MIYTRNNTAYRILGRFIKGQLNGYGKYEDISKDMFDTKITSLEGYFTNNKLDGKGIAKIVLNGNTTEINSGFFKNGHFVVNDNFDGFDENNKLFLKANYGNCRIYPTLLIDDFQPQGAFYMPSLIYGIYVSFKPSVFGANEISNITWSGKCENGLATGNGSLKVGGKRDIGTFRVNLQPFEDEVLYGELEDGVYKNCSVYEFNDWIVNAVLGSKPKKWIAFKDGLFQNYDNSEINNAYKEYNERIRQYRNQQNELSINYEIVLSKSNIASVQVVSTSNKGALIAVIDGGTDKSNVSSSGYSTTVLDKDGKTIKVYSNPFDDNGIDQPMLMENQLPGKVVVNYTSGNENRTVSLLVKKGGTYNLYIK